MLGGLSGLLPASISAHTVHYHRNTQPDDIGSYSDHDCRFDDAF